MPKEDTICKVAASRQYCKEDSTESPTIWRTAAPPAPERRSQRLGVLLQRLGVVRRRLGVRSVPRHRLGSLLWLLL